MSDSRPRLVDRFLAPHPYACRVWGCREVITWQELDVPGVGLGYCDAHRHIGIGRLVPMAIYGYPGEGWLRWPMGVAVYVQLAEDGALDADGRVQHWEGWHDANDEPLRRDAR